MKETLTQGMQRLAIELPEERVDAIVRFGAAVLEKNKVMNLTAITEPEAAAELHLLDSLQKRMRWLEEEALPELGVEARFLPGRAEDFARTYREKFDVVTSRAVARLDLLCELCLPFVHRGGYFLAMKGTQAEEELHEAATAIRLLGGSFERTEEFEIGGALHSVVVIHKTGKTPEQYPRSWARMKQKPL